MSVRDGIPPKRAEVVFRQEVMVGWHLLLPVLAWLFRSEWPDAQALKKLLVVAVFGVALPLFDLGVGFLMRRTEASLRASVATTAVSLALVAVARAILLGR